MKKDLNKLLTERQRVGSSRSYHEVRRYRKFDARDLDAAPTRESMTKRYRVFGNYKEFNEHLNPLWGVIRKNANRPWDKVYSELCRVFDMRSVINQHILTHLFDFVCIDVQIVDGLIRVKHRWGQTASLADTHYEYYVHPTTKLLLRNKQYRSHRQRYESHRKPSPSPPASIQLSENSELMEIESNWFIVEFVSVDVQTVVRERPMPGHPDRTESYTAREYPQMFDVVKDCFVQADRVAVSKRSASHKLLKQHGLAS